MEGENFDELSREMILSDFFIVILFMFSGDPRTC